MNTRIKVIGIVLVVLIFGLFVGIFLNLSMQKERADLLEKVGAESTLWGVYQLSNEHFLLVENLYHLIQSDYNEGLKEDALLRIDIMINRLKLMNGDVYKPLFDRNNNFEILIALQDFRSFLLDKFPEDVDLENIDNFVWNETLLSANILRPLIQELAKESNNYITHNIKLTKTDFKSYIERSMLLLNIEIFVVIICLVIVVWAFHISYKRQIKFKNMAEDYRKSRRQAMAASDAKSNFLAMISHELRTPLTGILSSCDLILKNRSSNDNIERRVMIMKNAANSLLMLLNDILDYSKLEAMKVDFCWEPFKVNDVIEPLIDLFDCSATEKNIELRLEASENVLNKCVKGDAGRIRQVLSNLIGNAIKFTDTGSVIVRIYEEIDNPGKISFEVEDSGIGISKNAQTKLFGLFVQAEESTSRKYGGTGLGLSICRKLVEGMNGKIDFSSLEGTGSIFWFVLPLEECIEDKYENKELGKDVSMNKLNILLAEDNEMNGMLFQEMLESEGHNVVWVLNGEEAYNESNKKKFDILILDIRMPVMDGLDAIKLIREKSEYNLNTPAVALTADAMDDVHQEGLELGFNLFVTKPVDWEYLFKTIKIYSEEKEVVHV